MKTQLYITPSFQSFYWLKTNKRIQKRGVVYNCVFMRKGGQNKNLLKDHL